MMNVLQQKHLHSDGLHQPRTDNATIQKEDAIHTSASASLNVLSPAWDVLGTASHLCLCQRPARESFFLYNNFIRFNDRYIAAP